MSSLTYGVRQFVNVMLVQLRFYSRHQVNIDAALTLLDPEFVVIMHTLLAAYDRIAALNKPGPD